MSASRSSLSLTEDFARSDLRTRAPMSLPLSASPSLTPSSGPKGAEPHFHVSQSCSFLVGLRPGFAADIEVPGPSERKTSPKGELPFSLPKQLGYFPQEKTQPKQLEKGSRWAPSPSLLCYFLLLFQANCFQYRTGLLQYRKEMLKHTIWK